MITPGAPIRVRPEFNLQQAVDEAFRLQDSAQVEVEDTDGDASDEGENELTRPAGSHLEFADTSDPAATTGPVQSAQPEEAHAAMDGNPTSAGSTSSCHDDPNPDTLRSSEPPRSAGQSRRNRNRQRIRAENKKKPYQMKTTSERQKISSKVVSAAQSFFSGFNAGSMKAAEGGFIGLRQKKVKRLYKLEVLLKKGFAVLEWDGRTPRPLVDAENRVFAVLAGRPPGSAWDEEVVAAAYREIDQTRSRCIFGEPDLRHRRGEFPVQASGISYGGGQERPKRRSGENESVMATLLASPPIRRIAGFANYAMQTWAPRLHAEYVRVMNELYARDPQLRPNLDNSIFASATVNFGPNVSCFPHVDDLNVPYGWCAITSLGNFDPTHGGHLVLWDLKIIIEFPPGSTILIPSATLRHSNIPIRPGETRASFTTYTAGGLFRWVAYGHRSQEDLEREDPSAWEDIRKRRGDRGRESLSHFSQLEDLCRDRPEDSQ